MHSPLATVRDEAHVCLDGGGAALAVGAAVQLVRASCAPLNAKSAVVRCTPVAVADGEIVRVGGDGCAEVRVRAGHVA
ncbi:MAG TPA: hypothetical protein VF997_03990, partial [Polyangia bacterium]